MYSVNIRRFIMCMPFEKCARVVPRFTKIALTETLMCMLYLFISLFFSIGKAICALVTAGGVYVVDEASISTVCSLLSWITHAGDVAHHNEHYCKQRHRSSTNIPTSYLPYILHEIQRRMHYRLLEVYFSC